jgi:hypothetical protein
MDTHDHSVMDPCHHFNTNPLLCQEYHGSESEDQGSHRSWTPVIKSRRRFSASETRYLRAEFEKHNNPPRATLQLIANTLGTTRRVVTTWFQNHRAKEKREKNRGTRWQKKNGKKQKTEICMNAAFENGPPQQDSSATTFYDHQVLGGESVMSFEWSSHTPSTPSSVSPLTMYPVISWSQSLPQGVSYYFENTSPLCLPPAIPQCCLDEMYTGFPCTFHSF